MVSSTCYKLQGCPEVVYGLRREGGMPRTELFDVSRIKETREYYADEWKIVGEVCAGHVCNLSGLNLSGSVGGQRCTDHKPQGVLSNAVGSRQSPDRVNLESGMSGYGGIGGGQVEITNKRSVKDESWVERKESRW